METQPKYVGFWPRAAAAIVDLLVISVIHNVIKLFILSPFYNTTGIDILSIKLLTSRYGISFIISALYFVLLTANYGGTLGKMALGIKVVREDMSPVTYREAIIREFVVKHVLYLPFAFISWLGVIWIAFDERKQGWHDKIAKTYVVEEVSKS